MPRRAPARSGVFKMLADCLLQLGANRAAFIDKGIDKRCSSFGARVKRFYKKLVEIQNLYAFMLEH